ncbi:MAG: phosphoribosylformylglycinamidine synthase subunit PurL [PS1 clade bacterium]|uniref:Phosphoribosylformylglycinamidine synthase subunit PurL n=1 Tax=PS1 clade bacterium TaxID=2175152 RepID=A0A937HFT7_9PROT|nr:phosphoribosylformylglycinamidine synthase subunit PurL [PS1 clade bacterium]
MSKSQSHINDTQITDEIVAEHGLTPDEYQMVCDHMGRTPNYTELGVFSVMWSEHCSYKSSRKWLKKLPVDGPQVIQGPGENAGVIDIGDGDAAVFKMESHNHPSFIEPYQGAATGVGGIMRDVFTMGARPVANLNALRFGQPDHPKTRHLVAGVVSGIGGYGNCIGVPTVGGEINFDKSYNGNILVNAMCVGVARTDKIFYAAATGIGSPVVYVGSKTGRDGIHGATMASAEFDDASDEKRPTVQVGDPFTEKLLLEACQELMASDAIIGIQDMGAAGLTSSSVEMADKGGVGIWLDLDKVPCRETHMTGYEMLLSESQERMLMVLKPGREAEAEAIFTRWGLDFAVIGELTDTGRMVVSHEGQTIADMPLGPLADGAPEYERPYVPTATAPAFDAALLTKAPDMGAALKTLMASSEIASRRWVYEQYDSMVMGDTLAGPGGDAAMVRVHGTDKALAISTDVTPRYCFADPVEGGKQAVAEAYRNISATGATPLAITNCLNFGNPERPEIMGQFVGCLEGMGDAGRALNFPVVSGNVSLYNETNGTGIMPTPAIGGVGLLKQLDKAVGNRLTGNGQVIYLLGETHGHLGASLYQRDVLANDTVFAPPPVDLEKEAAHGAFVRAAIDDGLLAAAHDISDGGLAVAIAEMSIGPGIGANITADGDAAFWFGEDQARYILVVETDDAVALEARAGDLPLTRIGTSGGTDLQFADKVTISVAELHDLNEGWFPALMQG